MDSLDSDVQYPFKAMHFDATTEELEKALPFTKGKWKPFVSPTFTQEELKAGGIIELKDIPPFTFATPYNVKTITTKELKQYIKTRPGVTSDEYVCAEVTSEYKRLPIEGKVVMDIGASIGAFTMYAFLKGAHTIISYEPNYENYRQFLVNCGHLEGVVIPVNAALIDGHDKEINFYLTTGKAKDGFSIIPFRGRTVERVAALNFHEELEKYKPSSIKMDVEGAEWELLKRPLPNYVKDIVIEIHFNKRQFRNQFEQLIAQFKDWTTIIEPKCSAKNFHTLAQYSR